MKTQKDTRQITEEQNGSNKAYNDRWGKPAGRESIRKAIEALKRNGINAELAESKEEAKEKALSLIKEGSEVMTMTSATLDSLGISKEIEESGKYNAIRKKLYSMERDVEGREMKKLGAAPEYAIGSFHALTEDGEIMIASNTGSQLPAYAYGSDKVIFVAGANKIVKDINEGMKRIYEHSLPLESERAKKAYGVKGSSVNKILIINKEIAPERIKVILADESLGF